MGISPRATACSAAWWRVLPRFMAPSDSHQARVSRQLSSPRGLRKLGVLGGVSLPPGLFKPLLVVVYVYGTVLAVVWDLWQRQGGQGLPGHVIVPEKPVAQARSNITGQPWGIVDQHGEPFATDGDLLHASWAWLDAGTSGFVGDQRQHKKIVGFVPKALQSGRDELHWQEIFELETRSGHRIRSRDCRLQWRGELWEGAPLHRGAKVLGAETVFLHCPGNVEVDWSAAVLRPAEGTEVLRVRLLFKTVGEGALIDIARITMWSLGVPASCIELQGGVTGLGSVASPGLQGCFCPSGEVDGSPLVDMLRGLWLAVEHPRAQHKVGNETLALFLADPEPRTAYYASLGVAGPPPPPGVGSSMDALHTLRRHFQGYLDWLRATPHHLSLLYDTRYDLRKEPCSESSPLGKPMCAAAQPMSEQKTTERLLMIHRELRARGVPLDGLLLDDGWDASGELWQVDPNNFPLGLAPVSGYAASRGAALGVWISPWGGFGEAGTRRLRLGATKGLEANSGTDQVLRLSGPKYLGLFRNATRDLAVKDGVRFFNFDGVGAGLGAQGAGPYARDVDTLLTLAAELRGLAAEADDRGAKAAGKVRDVDLRVLVSTGSWPSPFWLLAVDNIWRGGPDLGRRGDGPESVRQQWITFRDAMVYAGVVHRAPLFPLASVSHGGIVFSHVEESGAYLNSYDLEDFKCEVRSFFLSGAAMQELHIQPELLSPQHWDVLAEAANASRAYKDVLRDAHWVGGDPDKGEAYGYGSYGCTPAPAPAPAPPVCRGLLSWRNPAAAPQKAGFSLRSALGVPVLWPGGAATTRWQVRTLWTTAAAAAGPQNSTPPSALSRATTFGGWEPLPDSVTLDDRLGFTMKGLEVRAFEVLQAGP